MIKKPQADRVRVTLDETSRATKISSQTIREAVAKDLSLLRQYATKKKLLKAG